MTIATKTRPPGPGLSKDFFSEIIDSSPVVIFSCEPFGDYAATFISENIFDIAGYRPAQFLADPGFWASHIHPDDVDQVFEGLKDLFAQDHHTHEYRFRCADGQYLWMRDQLRLVRNGDNTPSHIVGSWLDISDRIALEKELENTAQAQALMHRLVVVANEATSPQKTLAIVLQEICNYMNWPLGHAYVPDPKGQPNLVSSKIWHKPHTQAFTPFVELSERMSFKSGAGLPGRAWGNKLPAWIADLSLDKDFHRNQMLEDLGVASGFAFPVFAGEEVVAVLEFFCDHPAEPDEFLMQFLHHIGLQIGRVFERAKAKRIGDEAQNGLAAQVEERTKALKETNDRLRAEIDRHKQTEDALRKSEERLDLAFKGSSDGLWDWNILTDEVYFSDRFKELLGYEPDELPHTFESFESRLHSEDHDLTLEAVKLHLEAQLPYEVEYRLRGKDGDYRWFLARGQAVWDSGNQPIRMAGSISDITERRLTEDQLRQSQKMESMGQLTGGIAHEFNNLLMVILGNLEMIEGKAGGDIFISEKTQQAIDGVLRGQNLTQQLLSYSRRQSLAPKVTDLNDTVKKASATLGRALGDNIEVDTLLENGLWNASADKNELEGALLNLCINARDAMPSGGRIVIQTSNISLDDQRPEQLAELSPGDYVLVSVTDNGMGIPQEILNRVFDPFFTTKEVGKGTGLGLSMIYGFARQSKGLAAIESRMGEGTTVSLYFPKAEAGQSAEEEAAPDLSEIPRGNEKILVVEDDAIIRAIALAMLEELGYAVLEAENGAAALDVLKTEQGIDLLMTDVMMPGNINGPQLAAQAKYDNPNLKIIFATGCNSDELPPENNDLHAGLLSKPYRKNELARKIRATLDS